MSTCPRISSPPQPYQIMNSTKAISSFQLDHSDMFAPINRESYYPSTEETDSLSLALLSPTRGGSFATNCFVSVLSKMGWVYMAARSQGFWKNHYNSSCVFCNNYIVIPKCSIEIEVQYYEKENGVLIKVESFVITAKDAPLREVFMSTASLMEVSLICHVYYTELLVKTPPCCCCWVRDLRHLMARLMFA